MDPITLLVTALAAGAATALKETAGAAIKDAYAGLKRVITDRYAAARAAVEQLEQRPASNGWRAVVGEDLDAAGAAQDDALLTQARDLLAALQAQEGLAAEAAREAGISIRDIEAGANVILRRLHAQDGIALEQIHARNGDFILEDARAGGAPADAPGKPTS